MNGMDSLINSTNGAMNAYATKESTAGNAAGKTIGQPKLSEKAQKYYDELKSKYQDLDFVLVSKDMKDMAKANAASFANPNKTVVLIDEEKIERMAEDEEFRKKYEGIIASAGTKLPELKQALGSMSGVKGFGMQVNDDGSTSFFAVMQKSFDAQAERIEKMRAEKKEERRLAEKKADKKEWEERLQEKREANKASSEEIISANSIEELIKKIDDYNFSFRADTVQTEAEKYVGTTIDFRG